MVRWRNTVETLALRGCTPPMVAFDLDLANMFGSIEWPEIRAAVDRHFVEASAWVTWCHAEPEVVQLPPGAEHQVTRGAGQGDVYGLGRPPRGAAGSHAARTWCLFCWLRQR